MRARGSLIAALLVAGCTRAAPLEIADDDALGVIVALLDTDGAVEAVTLMSPEQLRPFTARRDAPVAVVTFPLLAEDLLRADGGEVDESFLAGLRVRKTEAAPETGVGACGRCVEVPQGGLQVVHAGDSCAPLSDRARLFAMQDGALVAVAKEKWSVEAQGILRNVVASIRLDWPGACASPVADRSAAAVPGFAPISPVDEPYPPWAIGHAEDGGLGLFGHAGQTLWAPDETTVHGSVDLGGRPRVAVSLPDFQGQTSRYLVVSGLGQEGTPERSRYTMFWREGDTLGSTPASLDGVRDAVNFEVHWTGTLDTPEGPRIALAGGRAGRPEIALCSGEGRSPSCTTVTFEGAACADVGPIRDMTSTPRGWFGVAEQAFLQAEPTAGGTLRGWCHRPAEQDLNVWSDAPRTVSLRLWSTVALADNIFVCAEPEGWNGHAAVLQANLAGQTPFEGLRLDFSVVADVDSARCGKFGVPLDELGSTSPRRLRLDLMGSLMDVFPEGGASRVDGAAYYAETGLPHSAVHQVVPGWIVHRTGWAVEPRGLGSAILTRSVDGDWMHVAGLQSASSLIEAVARDDDVVAFNAFTDADPVRIELSDPPRLTAVPQAPGSEMQVQQREAVEAAAHVARTNEVLLLGNIREGVDGIIRDNDDRTWKPFLRRVSSSLATAEDIPLPLARGHFVCDATWLTEDELLIVGGQGTLLLYNGQRFEPVEIDYDDPSTEKVEEAPILANTGVAIPHFLAVSAVNGVAWVAGARGLVVRVARERREGEVRWVARRVSIERDGPEGLRTPLTGTSRFTHVVALSPDEAIFAAHRRPVYLYLGCPRPRRERHPVDNSDWVYIGPSTEPSAKWPLYWRTWEALPERSQLLELVSGGLVRTPQGLFSVAWDGVADGRSGPLELPFYPSAATVAKDGRVVLVGTNMRVAISE